MKFRLGQRQYEIQFRYEQKRKNSRVRTTICNIVDITNRNAQRIVARGEATNHSNDQFCRDKGRKEALKNAMSCTVAWARHMGALRTQQRNLKARKVVWSTYLNRGKQTTPAQEVVDATV